MLSQRSSVVYQAQPKVVLSGFIPELAFEFPDVPEEIFSNYILRAIDKLARDGNVLRRKAHIHVQEHVENYQLMPEDCMELVAVMRCRSVRSNSLHADVVRLTQEPTCIIHGIYTWFEPPDFIFFRPARHGDVFEIDFAVAPTFDACEVDRVLFTKYYDTVMYGVRSYLYAMPDKSWSDANKATAYTTMFLSGIRAAGIEAMTGHQRGAIRAKRPRVLY